MRLSERPGSSTRNSQTCLDFHLTINSIADKELECFNPAIEVSESASVTRRRPGRESATNFTHTHHTKAMVKVYFNTHTRNQLEWFKCRSRRRLLVLRRDCTTGPPHWHWHWQPADCSAEARPGPARGPSGHGYPSESTGNLTRRRRGGRVALAVVLALALPVAVPP